MSFFSNNYIHCYILLDGYNNKKVKYKWATDDGNTFLAEEKVKKLPQFSLKNVSLSSKINHYFAGKLCLSHQILPVNKYLSNHGIIQSVSTSPNPIPRV